jgi:hypothetical protein
MSEPLVLFRLEVSEDDTLKITTQQGTKSYERGTLHSAEVLLVEGRYKVKYSVSQPLDAGEPLPNKA